VIIENKVNEEGYSEIEHIFTIDKKVYGLDYAGVAYLLEYRKPDMIYINTDPVSVDVPIQPINVRDRKDLMILFDAIRTSKREEKLVSLPYNDIVVVTPNSSVAISGIVSIENDILRGLYCVTDNDLLRELHVDNVTNSGVYLRASFPIGSIKFDDLTLSSGIVTKVTVVKDFDLEYILNENIKYGGRHYGC